MAFKEKLDQSRVTFMKRLTPYLKSAYINIRNGLKSLGNFLLRTLSAIVGHLQNFWRGYLILICIAFVIATFLFVYQTTKIAKQIVIVAESIKKIEALNDQSFQQSRQILLHIVLDMQVDSKMQPAEFNDVPIFKGLQFNQYAQKSKYDIYIKNESPFYYEGNIFLNIGLNYFDAPKNEWVLKTLPYELSRRLTLAPNDLIKIELTNDLLNSGTLPKNLGKEEAIRIDTRVHFEEAFQPKVKITHRLSYF
jgi:hypothetical protein